MATQVVIASPSYSTYQATPSRARAKGKALRPKPSTEQPPQDGADEESDEIIICEILNFTTPKKIKIKKEKKDKKAKSKKSTRKRTSSAPRTPLALRNPPVEDDLHLTSLFGSISGDEDRDEADRSIHRPRN